MNAVAPCTASFALGTVSGCVYLVLRQSPAEAVGIVFHGVSIVYLVACPVWLSLEVYSVAAMQT